MTALGTCETGPGYIAQLYILSIHTWVLAVYLCCNLNITPTTGTCLVLGLCASNWTGTERDPVCFDVHYSQDATAILFAIFPIFSISISTKSPSLSHFCGCMQAAIPLNISASISFCQMQSLLRSSRHNDSPLPQSHALTQKPDNGVDAKDQLLCRGALPQFFVDPCFQ